jgi:hypothetical protein
MSWSYVGRIKGKGMEGSSRGGSIRGCRKKKLIFRNP